MRVGKLYKINHAIFSNTTAYAMTNKANYLDIKIKNNEIILLLSFWKNWKNSDQILKIIYKDRIYEIIISAITDYGKVILEEIIEN